MADPNVFLRKLLLLPLVDDNRVLLVLGASLGFESLLKEPIDTEVSRLRVDANDDGVISRGRVPATDPRRG